MRKGIMQLRYAGMGAPLKCSCLANQSVRRSAHNSQLQRESVGASLCEIRALERALPKVTTKLKSSLLAQCYCGCG